MGMTFEDARKLAKRARRFARLSDPPEISLRFKKREGEFYHFSLGYSPYNDDWVISTCWVEGSNVLAALEKYSLMVSVVPFENVSTIERYRAHMPYDKVVSFLTNEIDGEEG